MSRITVSTATAATAVPHAKPEPRDSAPRLKKRSIRLKNGGTLIVGGPRYEQGMMFMSIGASTGPRQLAPAEATSPAEATK